MFCGSVVSDTVDINVLLGHFNKNFLTVQHACHLLTPSFIHSLSKSLLNSHNELCTVLDAGEIVVKRTDIVFGGSKGRFLRGDG